MKILKRSGGKAYWQELMTLLRNALEENPNDQRGLELLARNEARLGDFVAAYGARRVLYELP